MNILRPDPIVRLRNPSGCTGFTLVEMLVVVSIVLSLMGIVSAALIGAGRANSLSNAGNQIAAMVGIARQNSMTKNALTALVIPTGENSWNSCILYELTPKADGSKATTVDWRPISKWITLPPAIAIDDCEFPVQSDQKDFPDLPSIVPPNGEAVTAYRFIVFTPRGALYPFPSTSARNPTQSMENPALRLVEGIRIGENAGDVKYTGTGKQVNFYQITILCTTGVPKIDRL